MKQMSIDNRISRLETYLTFFVALCLVLTAGLAVTVWMQIRTSPVHAQDRPGVLRVRGLIVEDASGRARIILGAPVPAVSERRRTDPATGMVVLSETGVDRLAIGSSTPAPQVGGNVPARVASQSGMVFDDADGNERGGFGYLDNGTVALGLDYPGREGVSLAIVPQSGFAVSDHLKSSFFELSPV